MIYSHIIGWTAWLFTAFLALSLTWGCRTANRKGLGFQQATAVQTLFWWVVALIFLFTPLNKLHILWLLPVLFCLASFLTMTQVPFLSKATLLLTHLFMAVVLIGSSSPTQRTILFWAQFLKEIEEEDKENLEKWTEIIKTFLIPDNISIEKFRANGCFIFNRGFLLENDEKISPTLSAKKLSSPLDRPTAYPQWFLCAYPDIVTYFMTRVEDDEDIFLNALGNIPELELFDSDHHIKSNYLRTLVNTYCTKTGRILECGE